MDQPGRAESRDALQRIERQLNAAKDDIGQGNATDTTRQRVEDAYSACDEIGRGLGESLKPLINNVRDDLCSSAPARTVVIDISVALAGVENVRPSL